MKNLLLTLLLLATSHASAKEHRFTSGPGRTDLVELYTSEGCSSCPPADRKMAASVDNKQVWIDFVPIAFHVDYWNYIGWIDPFSSPAFSARQRAYSREWKASRIFTPCFVVNGEVDSNPWKKKSTDAPGILKVHLNDKQAVVTFAPAQPASQQWTAWVAPLSGAESVAVKSGENRGKTLKHNVVALGLEHQKMTPTNGTYSAELTLPKNPKTKAIAVWVTSGTSQKPVQATGGWLNE